MTNLHKSGNIFKKLLHKVQLKLLLGYSWKQVSDFYNGMMWAIMEINFVKCDTREMRSEKF